MAELTPLYMDISGVYSGDELGLPYRDIMGEGVVGSGDLAVTQHAGGANLSVDVAAGAAWVLGDTNTDAQPCYRVRNDAVVNKGITPDPSNPRKVIIVAQITDATFAGATRQWAIAAIHGTPAASPSEPALPASALKLAVITVPAAATTIVTANIADSRTRAKVGGGQAQVQGGGLTGRVRGSDGAILAGSGFTVARTGTGVYTVTYSPALAAVPALAVSLAPSGATAAVVSGVFEATAVDFKLAIYSSTFAAVDCDFTFMTSGIS